ncbi:MAG TPA: hypothetical protein VGI33_20860 [Paenibacillus sp.]|jgi:hypothetical protein
MRSLITGGITVDYADFEAFQAMVKFLEKHYFRTYSDDIVALLGDLRLLEDGPTADPADGKIGQIACKKLDLKHHPNTNNPVRLNA